MDAGLVVGLSLGLAVLVLIILVFSCKFAKKNKEDIHDFAKEQLLGDRAVSRRRGSKSKRHGEQNNGETDYKKIDHREKTQRNKSVTFYDGNSSDRIQTNDREETTYGPRQQLLREHTECNDNNGIRRTDEWSRNCEMDYFGDYRERGCKRKKNVYSSGRMKIRNSNKDDEGYDKRQKYLRMGQYYPQMEILNDKEDGVQHYPMAEQKRQKQVLQHATVKQIVEDVKRNSKHNLKNGTRIRVNYNTLYTDTDIEGNHLYERKENINSSSGKSVAQTHATKKDVQNRDSARLLSRPQQRQQQFVHQEWKETPTENYMCELTNATEQEPGRYREKKDNYMEWSAEDAPVHHILERQTSASIPLVHTHHQPRPAPPVSIPLASTHIQSRPAPPVSIPSNNVHQQAPPAPPVSIPLAQMHLQSRPAPSIAIPSTDTRQSRPISPVPIQSTHTQGQSRPTPYVSIPSAHTHQQSCPAPPVPEKPAKIIYKQPPLTPLDFNFLTSEAPTSGNIDVESVPSACPCDHAAAVSKEDLQYNDERADSISENSSFSEALATWMHHSETGVKIPRPSTTTPYIIYSQRASTQSNAQRSIAPSSREEPKHSKLKQNVASASGENTMSNTDRTRIQMKHAVPAPPASPSPPSSVPSLPIPLSTNVHTSTDYQSINSTSFIENQHVPRREPGDNLERQHSPSSRMPSPRASQHSSSRKMILPETSQHSPSRRMPSPKASQHSPSRMMPSPEASQHLTSKRISSTRASQHSPSRKMILPESSQHSPSRRMPSPEASQPLPSRRMLSPEAFQHSPSRRTPSPDPSQHSPSRTHSPEASQHSPSRLPLPEASQHSPSRRIPSPKASQHSPSRKMSSPEASQHSLSRRIPLPEASQHSPDRRIIALEASQHSPSRRMPSPEAYQHSPSGNMISSDASQWRYAQILSPTRDQQAGLQITRTDNQKSSTAKIQLQLSPQRTFQAIPQQPLSNVEQSSLSSVAANVDPHVLLKVNIPMLLQQSPDKKEEVQTLYQNESKLSSNKESEPESDLQSEPPAALACLKPSPPPRPRQKPSKQYRSQKHITFTDTTKPLNQSRPNSTDDQSSMPFDSPERINQGTVSAEEYTLQEPPENTPFQQIDESPAKHLEMTDLENLNDEEEQSSFDAFFDGEKPEPDYLKETRTAFKESVEVIASESEFNPGQTSTPQQSTMEVFDSKNERSDRSMLHSLLKKRRERIVSSSQDLSRLCSGEQDSFWDESISLIKKSVSLDGRSSQLHLEDDADEIDHESLCRTKSDLTEKIATVRDIRNDPDINALLADIKARRKSSSSFN